jgi:hypothetical protein
MDKTEVKHENDIMHAERDAMDHQHNDGADHVAEIRRSAEQKPVQQSKFDGDRNTSNIAHDKVHFEPDMNTSIIKDYSDHSPDEVAYVRRDKLGETLAAKNHREVSTTHERAYGERQTEHASLTADEIADIRRDSAKETSSSLEKQIEDRHQKNYQEFMDQFSSKNIEFKSSTHEYVKVVDTKSLETSATEWNEGQREFWRHHGNNREFYDSMVEKYPTIKEQLDKGKPLEELKLNPELQKAIEFWWSKTDPVKFTQYKDSYFVEQGFHRVTLAKEHRFDEIPAVVNKAQSKG